jgi:sigma-B regulation protein RsbU (phosphoserine phosphatase)
MRILVADDEPVSQFALVRTLEQWGHTAELANDGLEACLRLTAADPPTLGILDWMMPGLDGIEVCQRVRAARLRVDPYLIMLTTRSSREDLVEGLRAGADDYMVKPFDRVELQARLQVGIRVVNLHLALADRIRELEESRAREHDLRTLMPICSYCKKICNEQAEWLMIDRYLTEHGYEFTHAVCPDCTNAFEHDLDRNPLKDR